MTAKTSRFSQLSAPRQALVRLCQDVNLGHPPLTPSACRGTVKTGFGLRMARMRARTISDRLDVTPNEAALLERLAPATRFKPRDPVPPTPKPSEIQARTITDRPERIARVIAELGYVPPVRDMARRLAEAGPKGNHDTVDRDYTALGIESGRTRAARSEMKSRQPLLPGVSEVVCSWSRIGKREFWLCLPHPPRSKSAGLAGALTN
jgi:hypothetical protein